MAVGKRSQCCPLCLLFYGFWQLQKGFNDLGKSFINSWVWVWCAVMHVFLIFPPTCVFSLLSGASFSTPRLGAHSGPPALALLCASSQALSWRILAPLPPQRCQILLSFRATRRTGAESWFGDSQNKKWTFVPHVFVFVFLTDEPKIRLWIWQEIQTKTRWCSFTMEDTSQTHALNSAIFWELIRPPAANVFISYLKHNML